MAQLSPILLKKNMPSRHPGLVAKNKPFQTPFLTKTFSKVDEQVAANSRSLKRASDANEQARNDEDDEDDMLVNQDLEALCQNQSLAKRKKI